MMPAEVENQMKCFSSYMCWTSLLDIRPLNALKARYLIPLEKCQSEITSRNMKQIQAEVSLLQSAESLLSELSGVNTEDVSPGKLYPKRCLSLWRKSGFWHAESTRRILETMSINKSIGSRKNVSEMRGNSRIVTENETILNDCSPCDIAACSPELPSWRCFTLAEILSATRNFNPDNIVGKGGYAKVYKGTLVDGQVIAIKKLDQSDSDELKEKDFLVEIGIMAHISHPNTTPLLGFCLEGGLYLVYKFYPHGSLASILHGPRQKTFDWPLRYKVAIGTARGLLYLHEKCRRRIIHRDIKASNVLLDDDYEPQISDFGLAKWLPREWTHHSVSPIEGTFGYLAPEYHMHGIVDEKTDIYSFGVLLLEIISGRRAVDDDQQCLVNWARPLLESRNIQDLADPELRGSFNYHQMHSMIITAEMCVRQSSISRPSTNQVLKLLYAR